MKKKAAVIGYGGMGGWHVDHLLKSDVCELAGVYDIKKERQDLAVSRGIRAYSSREELLSDPEIDLVTIAIPNDVHEEVAIDAMNHGKNVISEKPVTLSLESLDRMIECSKKNNVIFTVHQNRRWDVDYLAMQHLADSGEIGDIINIESRIHGSRGIPSDWRGIKKYGGGMLYDWGVHLIDQILLVMGYDVGSVRCTFDHITNNEVDDGFKLYISFKSGKEAFIEVGTYNFIAMPRFYLRAKNGSALLSDWREKCKVVKCKAWHESDVIPVQTAAGLTKTMAPRDEITTDTYEIEKPASDVHDFYRNIVKAIDGQEKQIVTHEQMRSVLKVIMKAFESAENDGSAVKYDD